MERAEPLVESRYCPKHGKRVRQAKEYNSESETNREDNMADSYDLKSEKSSDGGYYLTERCPYDEELECEVTDAKAGYSEHSEDDDMYSMNSGGESFDLDHFEHHLKEAQEEMEPRREPRRELRREPRRKEDIPEGEEDFCTC